MGAGLKTAYAAEQNRPDVEAAREARFEGQPDLDPTLLVFLDETWTATDMARLHRRSSRGEQLRPARASGRCDGRYTFVQGD